MTPHTAAMIDVHALSRIAFSAGLLRGGGDAEPRWPGNPGELGGLTNEEIDFLLDRFESAEAGHPRRAA
jgi:hypothetical protein